MKKTKSIHPLGLHLHVVSVGEQLRLGLWFELQPMANRRRPAPNTPHPSCLPHDKRPPFLPEALIPLRFVVRLPCANNGPIPLPGFLALYDAPRIELKNRELGYEHYLVQGWFLPAEFSAFQLLDFIEEWRAVFGEGLVGPQVGAVEEFLQTLLRVKEEREGLPTLFPLGLDPKRLESSFLSAAPVSSEELYQLWDNLRQEPFLGALDESGKSTLGELYPRRFAGLLLSLLRDTAKSYSDEERSTLSLALYRGDRSIVEMHRAKDSCLYPTHLIFQREILPQGNMHGIVRLKEGSEAPYQLDLGLRQDEAELPLSTLLRQGALRAPTVEHERRLWARPASVLLRDWSLLASRAFYRRPELLEGQAPLTQEEAMGLLQQEPIKGEYYAYKEFIQREGITATLKRSYNAFTVSPEEEESVRLRVRWEPTKKGEQDSLSNYFFLPLLTLTLGETELEIEEAQKLLAESSAPILQVGSHQVSREKLQASVELAKARQKVLEKLKSTDGFSFATVLSMEDQWSAEGELSESFFAAQFERFLENLRGGSGVPAVLPGADFAGELRPYQARGVSWLAFLSQHGLGGCLADDMGLGKTVQVLALLSAMPALSPALIICPTSVVFNWGREAAKFLPKAKVYLHQGANRALNQKEFEARTKGCAVVITSFSLIRMDREFLERKEWPFVCVDEAQNIKNPSALQTRAIKALNARTRLALTGTPVENRLNDLWSIYDFAFPGLLGGLTRFAKAFLSPIRNGNQQALHRLQRRISPFLLRRKKSDPLIADDLPDKQEQEVFCALSKEQTALYHAMSEAALKGILDETGLRRRAHILAALTRLKQICNHPESFAREEPNQLLERSGKLDRTLEILEELLEEGQATLIFTQYTEMGEVLVRAIEERFEVFPKLFHGGLSAKERQEMIDAFQRKDGPPVLILSLKAGGSGLNLTRASAVIHYDRWWNPAVEDQATDRAHRIGQTQKVNVYKMVTRGTLEERIARLMSEKKAIAEQVLSGADESWLTEFNNDELVEFFSLKEADI